MILKSLSVIPAVEIQRLNRKLQSGNEPSTLTFADSGLNYFGVYLKLFRGYFSEYAPDSKVPLEAANVFFVHYFNMLVLRSLIEALQDAESQGILRIDEQMQRLAVEQIDIIGGFQLREFTFRSLIARLRQEENEVGRYVSALRLEGDQPQYRGLYTMIDTFLNDACAVVIKSIPSLPKCRIYFLLDEYENLKDFQQRVVNTLAKLRPSSLSLKIAARAGGLRCMENLQGDAMQVPRDYQFVSLDYDIAKKDYRDLLLEIARKRLCAEGFRDEDLSHLLPPAPPRHPASVEEVDEAIRELLRSADIDPAGLTSNEWRERVHQWGDAMVFRLNQMKQQPRTYAGFADFVQLFSGIISNFLEICKLAFYMAEWDGINVREGQPIPWKVQNEAVYKTSQAAFDWISRNIADTGPMISRFVMDLGDIFRDKLLGHTSEPEAARLVLTDPAVLDQPEYKLLEDVLHDAVRWSVLQTPGQAKAYLPKHNTDIRPTNYYPNRILAPILRISPNYRWQTLFAADELFRLLREPSRSRTRKSLIQKHSGLGESRRRRTGNDHGETDLFEEGKGTGKP